MLLRRFSFDYRHLRFGLAILCLGFPGAARAEESRLTDSNIRAFIDESSSIIAGNSAKSTEEIRAYLEKHLDPKAHFSSAMIYNVPGYPSQETAMNLKKTEFIETLSQGGQALSNYENKVTIKKINISEDETKATVETTGYETGIMDTPTDGPVPVEGHSKCLQILMLNDGVIQMYSATCKTTIEFQQ